MGAISRAGSPFPGRSILMTSAPWSARIMVQYGPAICCSKPSTRMPSRGLGTGNQRLLGKWRLERIADAGDGFDLDQGVLFPQRGDPEQGLRWIVLAKVPAVGLAQ